MSRVDSPQAEDLFSEKEKEPAVELKGSVFTLPVLRLRSLDLSIIEAELRERLSQGLRFFENAPVVIDVEPLRDSSAPLDLGSLVDLLRTRQLVPVGLRHGTTEQNQAALAAGLAVMKGGATQDLPQQKKTPEPSRTTPASMPAKIVRQPVRSGQRVYAQGTDLVVLAPVNAGAEIIADGHIHVYAPLRGRALAGVRGDTSARVFTLAMEAELVAVAGNFRVFEDDVPAEVRGKTAQVYLDNDEQLILEPLSQNGPRETL